jgi:PAS domain-containing protein
MERYRILLVADEPAAIIPAPRRRTRAGRPQPDEDEVGLRPAVEALLRALRRVNRRGPGRAAWASLANDPLTFLLERMTDPLVLRDREGQTIYANPAARDLGAEAGLEFREHHFFLDNTNPQMILSLYSRARTQPWT